MKVELNSNYLFEIKTILLKIKKLTHESDFGFEKCFDFDILFKYHSWETKVIVSDSKEKKFKKSFSELFRRRTKIERNSNNCVVRRNRIH